MRGTGANTPLCEINLEVSSWVEGRGVRHTNWSVKVNDAWVPIAELRDVARTVSDAGVSYTDEDDDEFRVLPPGCQYRVTYHPRLAVGTQLLRRVSMPLTDAERQEREEQLAKRSGGDPMRQLTAAPWKVPLRVAKAEFRVVGNHRYVNESQWQSEHAAGPKRRREPVRERHVATPEIESFVELLRSGRAGGQ